VGLAARDAHRDDHRRRVSLRRARAGSLHRGRDLGPAARRIALLPARDRARARWRGHARSRDDAGGRGGDGASPRCGDRTRLRHYPPRRGDDGDHAEGGRPSTSAASTRSQSGA
jgi:hypothetical protein